ncbi:MAG: alpha/beta hydrolase [Geminicoccaceae bacterium]|nr:alpha/beta hydrolase [Geminicoccaceae bacterium]
MRRLRRLALLLLLAGCARAELLDALTPTDGYRLESGLAYGDHPRQRLDLYRPERPREDRALVVFFYGGSWQAGERALYRFVGQGLAARGYAVAIPDYRLFPEVRWREILADGAVAVGRARAALDPAGRAPLILAGHSAGAWIAAMLALDPCRLPDRPDAWLGLAGPYDFLPLRDPVLIAGFGPGEPDRASQPVSYVDGPEPATLLVHGSHDVTVLARNSERLAAMLQAVGTPVELVRLESGHVLPLLGLSSRFAHLAPFVDRLDALLAESRAAGREPPSGACLRDLSGARGTRAGRRRRPRRPRSVPSVGHPARLRLVARRRPR